MEPLLSSFFYRLPALRHYSPALSQIIENRKVETRKSLIF